MVMTWPAMTIPASFVPEQSGPVMRSMASSNTSTSFSRSDVRSNPFSNVTVIVSPSSAPVGVANRMSWFEPTETVREVMTSRAEATVAAEAVETTNAKPASEKRMDVRKREIISAVMADMPNDKENKGNSNQQDKKEKPRNKDEGKER